MTNLPLMVAEDDPATLKIIEHVLRSAGFAPHVYADPRQLLEEMHRINPVVLITDYHMPEMNGLELVRTVRQSFPELYVIMLTGSVGPAEIPSALEVCDDFIAKPIVKEEFLARLMVGLRLGDLQMRLQRTVNDLEQVLNVIPHGLLLVDSEYHIREANPAACRLSGWPRGQILGKDLLELFTPESQELLLPELVKVFTLNLDLSGGTATLLRPGGEIIPVTYEGASIVFQGQPAALVMLQRIEN